MQSLWFCCLQAHDQEAPVNAQVHHDCNRKVEHQKVKMDSASSASSAPTASYADLAKGLHEKTCQLGTHLENLSTINMELKERCEKALTALRQLCGSDTLGTRVTCSVCYSRERSHALLPCGHAGLCESCSARMVRRGRCPNCRAPVESNVRIYL